MILIQRIGLSMKNLGKSGYKQTVDLGWQKNFKSPDYNDNEVIDGIVYPWENLNPHIFSIIVEKV